MGHKQKVTLLWVTVIIRDRLTEVSEGLRSML